MSLSSTHPEYDAHVDEWLLLRRAYKGEKEIKRHGELYLPPTAGQRVDGMGPNQPGRVAYEAYKARARFPTYVREAVENFVGMMHQKPPTFELTPRLEALLERATNDGESLGALLRRINVEQLLTGRLGLLADLPADPATPDTVPYLALYIAEAIINWDESRDHKGVNAFELVVLDESGYKREGLEWRDVERYRVLMLNDQGQYVQEQVDVDDGGDVSDPDAELMTAPSVRGKVLEQIPFVVINAQDIVATPDQPPLLPLADDCLGIYRGEADYRQSLHNQGQDTLVICNNGTKVTSEEGEVRIGAGAVIELEADGDAKFIGTNSEGIPEQRTALENDRKAADSKAGTLISPSAGKQESGDALSTRLAAQTASLMQIALNGALGLQNALRIIAEWVGDNPEAVKVTPNTEFAPVVLSGQEVLQLVTARMQGAPISFESIHGVMRDRGLTKFDYDTEQDKIAEEDIGRAELIAKLPVPPLPLDPNKAPPDEEDDEDAAPAGSKARE